jgi:hypothetical protein
MSSEERARGAWVTWGLVFLLVLYILIKGAFTYFLVGDLGPPTWDYRPVMDVPGQSPYAIYKPLPFPQHVRGPEGE